MVRTLGCPKNEADSEALGRELLRLGHGMTDDESEADCVIVNTCAFIRQAVEESLEAVMETRRRIGRRRLLVTGCLVGRYGEALSGLLAEADGFFRTDDRAALARLLPGRRRRVGDVWAGGRPWTYVKIAEGCDRRCSFCVIPSIRGPFRSRPAEEVLEEVRRKVRAGFSEVVLVAQDLTAWGKERGSSLVSLLRRLARLRGEFVLRLLYLYPSGVDRRLLDFMLGEPKVVDYFDFPVQHAAPAVLRAMRRSPTEADRVLDLVGRIRRRNPDAAVRATVMVGFPAEDRSAFGRLMGFVETARFNHLGCFAYSAEEGAAAAAVGDPVRPSEKSRRLRAVMALQRRISREWLGHWVGRTVEAVSDGEVSKGLTAFRNGYFAPEVDGRILVTGRWPVGERRLVRVTAAGDYDLRGVVT